MLCLNNNSNTERIEIFFKKFEEIIVLILAISIYTICTMPGALEGVIYYIKPDFSKFSFMTVIADARLERDSCIIESELGVVDASLSTQLKALENAFKSKIQQQ